ncbi:hypothetical protein B0H14DRAFT_3435165 [Mycena olivaceomarginata]|nr:hypothetical protein B0H14DRAFT_3435165 [Mycena olivaceomarginata]
MVGLRAGLLVFVFRMSAAAHPPSVASFFTSAPASTAPKPPPTPPRSPTPALPCIPPSTVVGPSFGAPKLGDTFGLALGLVGTLLRALDSTTIPMLISSSRPGARLEPRTWRAPAPAACEEEGWEEEEGWRCAIGKWDSHE